MVLIVLGSDRDADFTGVDKGRVVPDIGVNDEYISLLYSDVHRVTSGLTLRSRDQGPCLSAGDLGLPGWSLDIVQVNEGPRSTTSHEHPVDNT